MNASRPKPSKCESCKCVTESFYSAHKVNRETGQPSMGCMLCKTYKDGPYRDVRATPSQAVAEARVQLTSYFNDAHCPPGLRAAWDQIQQHMDTPRQPLFPMGEQGNEWYFDCEDYYIDVARYPKDGTYSVFFRKRDDDSEGWYDQADDPGRVRTPMSLEELQHLTAGLLFSPPANAEKIQVQEALQFYTSGWRAMGTQVLKQLRKRIDKRRSNESADQQD